MFDFSKILSAEYVKENGVLWDDDFTLGDCEKIFDRSMDKGGKPVTELVYELYPDGNLVYYAYYRNGYQYGEDVEFYKSGKVSGYTMLTDDEFYSYEFYENGQIKIFFERYRDDNAYYRRQNRYDENGNQIIKQINCEVNFIYRYNETDSLHDVSFHDNGEFKKIIWKSPDRSDFYRSAEFDEKGYPVNLEINPFYNPEYFSLKNNKLHGIVYSYDDKKFRLSGSKLQYAYSDGYFSDFTGKVYFCYPTGEVRKVNEYMKGVLWGRQSEYYKSGQILEFSSGLRCYRWYENGVLKEVNEYRKDSTLYRFTMFDRNGNKRSEIYE